MSSVPKAILYYNPRSVWSAVALLALEEKGYGEDEVDLKIVDLAKGENFAPSFLRLNPKATVPTLVVPLQNTLSEDIDSRYKAITESKAIVEFLDKSRSSLSRTHTTSAAPAPALAPATIAFNQTSTVIISEILHSDAGSPNNLMYLNARDEKQLKSLAAVILPFLVGKNQALERYISEAQNETIHVSEKVKQFWSEKQSATKVFLDVFGKAQKANDELDVDARKKREEYFKEAKLAWEVSLKDSLTRLNQEIIGPYTLGDQLSLADLHLAAWLSRIAMLAGAVNTDDGHSVVTKLESHVGNGFKIASSASPSLEGQRNETSETGEKRKLSVFWDAMKERPSWKKVYGNGLY